MNPNIDSVIAVIPVRDQAEAVAWYQRLLGRTADIVPMEGIAEWQIAENAWLQVTTDPEPAGSTTVIINVVDLEAQLADCAEAGLSRGEVVEYPGIVKMFEVTDPDGNKVAFVQDISGGA